MPANKSKAGTDIGEKRADADERFQRTVKRMLEAPPKPHDEMRKGATQKRDSRSSEGPTKK